MKANKLVILFCLISGWAFGQQVSLLPENPSIELGQPIDLNLEVRLPAQDSLQWPKIDEWLNESIEVLSISKVDSSFNPDQVRERILRQSIRITAFDTGYFPIPPLAFGYKNDTLFSPGLVLEVYYNSADTSQTLADIYDIEEVPLTFAEVWNRFGSVFLAVWFGLALLAFAFWRWRKYLNREKPELEIKVEPSISAHEWALEQLEGLKQAGLWKTDPKAYYSQISWITRNYLQRRYEGHYLESTTPEIIAAMQFKLAENELGQLKELLNLTDLVKFAKFKPEDQLHISYFEACQQFVESTKTSEEHV